MAQQRGASKKSKSSAPSEGSNQLLLGIAAGGGVAAIVALIAVFVLNRGGSEPQPAPSPELAVVQMAPVAPELPPVVTPSNPAATPNTPMAPSNGVASAESPSLVSATPAPVEIPSTGDPALDEQVRQTYEDIKQQSSAKSKLGPPARVAPQTAPPSIEMDLPDLIAKVDPAIVRINVKTLAGPSIGSGFVVSESGVVITNYHVIEGGQTVAVEFEDGRKATVLGFKLFDEARDIAIIQLDPADAPFPTIPLAMDTPRKGVKVAAFGAPLGLSFTATEGTVSNIRSGKELEMEGNYIQTDTPISPGNSGGPLVVMNGEVIGMNTFQFARGQNLNFAISVDDIREVLADSEGQSVQVITPSSVPSRRAHTPKFVDITGTERADKLLAQMKEAAVIVQPFPIDPTGRINEFMIDKLTATLEKRLKMTLTRIHTLSIDQPLIVMSVSFDIPENEKQIDRMASQLSVEVYVVMLDLDKDGNRNPSIVWKEQSKLAVLSIEALAQGNLTKSVMGKSQEFFSKFSQAVFNARKAHASL